MRREWREKIFEIIIVRIEVGKRIMRDYMVVSGSSDPYIIDVAKYPCTWFREVLYAVYGILIPMYHGVEGIMFFFAKPFLEAGAYDDKKLPQMLLLNFMDVWKGKRGFEQFFR